MLLYFSIYVVGIVIYYMIIDIEYEEVFTSKHARLSLIWPLLIIPHIFRGLIYMLNILIIFICLLFGFKYKETRLYDWIKKINAMIKYMQG